MQTSNYRGPLYQVHHRIAIKRTNIPNASVKALARGAKRSIYSTFDFYTNKTIQLFVSQSVQTFLISEHMLTDLLQYELA